MDSQSLFREEVAQARNERLHGTVVLSQPISTTVIVGAIVLVMIGALAWVVYGTFPRIETVAGVLATDRPSARLYPSTTGVISKIYVKDGGYVRANEPIATIQVDRKASSGEGIASAALASVRNELAFNRKQIVLSKNYTTLEAERLSNAREAALRELSLIKQKIQIQQDLIQSNEEMLGRIEGVLERGFVSRVEYERRRQMVLSTRQELATLEQQKNAKQGEADAARLAIDSLLADQKRAENQIEAAVEPLNQKLAQFEGDSAYLVTAPLDGWVTAFQAGVGSRADPQFPLAVVVPRDASLKAILYAPSRAIGAVHPGQEVRLLYDAFPFQQFGSFQGVVKAVSRTAINPKDLDAAFQTEEPVYRIEVIPSQQSVLAFGKREMLQPGMTLQANIILERRTFLDWFLAPLRAAARRSS
ncbi:membrane fusion protein [Hephaestia caeni]|uniref:Membrane fusion protein n=1 Tax=Hephaestia caeni TaxID=645617 RepID=A0A397PJ29_9SPHN|nr:HlyD family efflux transporter periplasmic adaptor subunit [Hephaestia caeni]RIA45681.1 membrane fusion protein [Hephaestia caeni]